MINFFCRVITTVCCSLLSMHVIGADNSFLSKLPRGQLSLSTGGYWRTAASRQFIHINELIGDQFTVNSGTHANGLFGVGYFTQAISYRAADIHYGIQWYYLPQTSVQGSVIQETYYPNLSYAYHVTSYPLYIMAKSISQRTIAGVHGTINGGIGPNFMTTSQFKESNLLTGNVIAIPDQIFKGKTTTSFSATLGAGLQWDHAIGKLPLTCGYQFYYLGQGGFTSINDQVQNSLKTGTLYANALTCGLSI